jgi:O-acetyl-ADP-ribose deacetylase
MSLPKPISIIQGDITRLPVDAIVNAANPTLQGGGGVDGAIHRAAGPQLLAECQQLQGCLPGEARLTKGYDLPARWVLHTVGPIWQDGTHHEDELLAQCYRSCFALLEEYDIRTVAFPSISTGAYGFPIDRASRIALRVTQSYLMRGDPAITQILFVCFPSKITSAMERLPPKFLAHEFR